MKPQPTHPVIEVFGPTVQGEGPEAGRPCYFVRLGGCDYRCSWCDSMYAVEPEQVRANAEQLTPEQIAARVTALPGAADWVILSGGNPALHQLATLVDQLHDLGYRVAVETQGSIWRPWLARVDRLVVSPKPPSSGMDQPKHIAGLNAFMGKLNEARHQTDSPLDPARVAIKVVVADAADYLFAAETFRAWPQYDAHLSVCTPQEHHATSRLREAVSARYADLCEKVAGDPGMAHVRVLPQLHVLAWGNERGR